MDRSHRAIPGTRSRWCLRKTYRWLRVRRGEASEVGQILADQVEMGIPTPESGPVVNGSEGDGGVGERNTMTEPKQIADDLANPSPRVPVQVGPREPVHQDPELWPAGRRSTGQELGDDGPAGHHLAAAKERPQRSSWSLLAQLQVVNPDRRVDEHAHLWPVHGPQLGRHILDLE